MWLEHASLRLAFTTTVFHKRALLQRFYAEYTESVLDILSYPESNMGPPWLGQEKKFQNGGSQQSGKRCFMIGFCKCSKCSFLLYVLSTDVQVSQSH